VYSLLEQMAISAGRSLSPGGSRHEPIAMIRTDTSSVRAAIRMADITDEADLRQALNGIEAVCHLAGLTRARESVVEPLRYFRVNTGGTSPCWMRWPSWGLTNRLRVDRGDIRNSGAPTDDRGPA